MPVRPVAENFRIMAAINALNGIYTMRGCEQPLIVQFADPKRPRPGEPRGSPAVGGPGFLSPDIVSGDRPPNHHY
ncbi:flowering time control protein FCA isoform X2 [Helianthus annuus]|uniref:flowering time control protein FCA isoform X2 n=1 Tax=Helianthus annuus TaxID=4232 RepID=UPI001652EE17|nr:flowering time control protein FCA isoform X2 [Helianthus annuus]